MQRLEDQAGMLYVSGAGSASWDDLGALMQNTGIASTDGMIANIALSLELAAIVTTDCDFVCLSSIVDIYMPLSVATLCNAYNAASD